MAIAAFVVSIFAVLVSLTAAYIAWLQVKVVRSQLHDQRAPKFNCYVEDMGTWMRLVLRLATPVPLSSVQATILGGGGLQFTPSQNGVLSSKGGPIQTASWSAEHSQQGTLTAGDRAMWRVAFNGPIPEEVHLRLDCVGAKAGDKWTVSERASIRGPQSAMGPGQIPAGQIMQTASRESSIPNSGVDR